LTESLAAIAPTGGVFLANMNQWWSGLDMIAQAFYMGAALFSVLFLWQLVAMLIGLAGGHGDMECDAHDGLGGDVHAEFDHDLISGVHPEFEHGAAVDGAETMVAFKLLSIRSIIAFFLLFSWAGALYLDKGGATATRAFAYAMGWGFGAMLLVAALFYLMKRMTETGSPRIASCLGTMGTVYLDIPADGIGEARVTVSGVISHVRARTAGGEDLQAGTAIEVTRILGPNSIEVSPTKQD